MFQLKRGVWPTMITPYRADGEIDFNAIEAMVEWYAKNGCAGIFAVCASSEMFKLSLAERVALARSVVYAARGKIGVIASGHVSDSIEAQIEELTLIAQTGPEAVVLVCNRLARQGEGDDVWIKNGQRILDAMPGIMFGVYECPGPYPRLMTPKTIAWCAETGRFAFLKDTCCSTPQMAEKLKYMKDTPFALYNANSATALETLRLGARGFSGVMANFHPDLYAWLCANFERYPKEAELLAGFLSLASGVERQCYPVSAKHHMQLEGIPIRLDCRTRDAEAYSYAARLEVEQLRALEKYVRAELGITP